MNPKELRVIATPESISVYWIHPGGPFSGGGAIEANWTSDTTWWIARAIVNPKSDRGQGIGSEMLQSLLKALRQNETCTKVIVMPGGYEGKTRKQFRFYKKNGFRHPVPADDLPPSFIPKSTLIRSPV